MPDNVEQAFTHGPPKLPFPNAVSDLGFVLDDFAYRLHDCLGHLRMGADFGMLTSRDLVALASSVERGSQVMQVAASRES